MSAFDPARILFEDDALLVVDKPEGVPSQAADPSRPDDLPYRLGLFLAARDGREDPYLGIHQRLDRDTSGVILYAKRKEANASLAAQLEGRQAEKRYLAVVSGWAGDPQAVLRHRLARDRDGRTAVVARGGQEAVSRVALRARRGERALLEVTLETGRTHQIRAQLAAVGAPVEGDLLYGGAPAPRLMLHAARIALRHPLTDAPLAVDAPAPPIFEAWLEGRYDPFQSPWLDDALARARERRWGLAHRDDTDAYRLVHEEGDGLPGLALDVYAGWLVAHLYEPALERVEVLDSLAALGFRGLYVKRRPRQANVIVDGRDEAHAPSAPLRGEPAPSPLTVREGGLPFAVRLGEGLSTGVFLDQRENRARVRALAGGRRVLNLFCYTGGFTLAAAAGGARATLSVDASGRLLDWARENLSLAGLEGPQHVFLRRDVFEALDAMAAEGARFDLVCVDPPTYSRTKAGRWTSGKDWERLFARVLAVLAPGGQVIACTNDRRLRVAAFRRHLHEGARQAGVTLARLKDLPCPADFPAPAGAEAHLKSALAEVARNAEPPPRAAAPARPRRAKARR